MGGACYNGALVYNLDSAFRGHASGDDGQKHILCASNFIHHDNMLGNVKSIALVFAAGLAFGEFAFGANCSIRIV
jgi:hypothetical protein